MAAPVIDQYSGLDHKIGAGAADISAAPAYANDFDKRRINAYHIIAAYMENVARLHLPEDSDNPNPSLPSDWREYGDPATLVKRISAGIVGRSPKVGVSGADAPIPPEPRLPPVPLPPDESLEGVEAAVRKVAYQVALERWEAVSLIEIERWASSTTEQPALIARQEWLRSWAEADQYVAKLRELEAESVVPFGDGVIVHGWDTEHNRPETEIWRPESYFPVLSAADPARFPSTVHLAYTFLDATDNETELVRRITYELVDINEEAGDVGQQPQYLTANAEWRHSCLYSDQTWLAEDVDDIYNIVARPIETGAYVPEQGAEPVPAVRIPLQLDFIPVVHLTHNLSRFAHFGRSPVISLAQLFDEMQGCDTDESLASAWAARPPTGIRGLATNEDSVPLSPGVGVALADDGAIFPIEMAPNLDKLLDRNEALRATMAVNGAVPGGILGRVDPTKVVSGYLLEVSFTPYFQTVSDARAARESKWQLSLKMVQRIAIQNGDPTIGENVVYPAEFQPGQFMPRDSAAIAELITALRQSDSISQRTAIAVAQGAVPEIDDVDRELAAARETMASTAKRITEATDDPGYALEFLSVGRRQREDSPDSPVTTQDDSGIIPN